MHLIGTCTWVVSKVSTVNLTSSVVGVSLSTLLYLREDTVTGTQS